MPDVDPLAPAGTRLALLHVRRVALNQDGEAGTQTMMELGVMDQAPRPPPSRQDRHRVVADLLLQANWLLLKAIEQKRSAAISPVPNQP